VVQDAYLSLSKGRAVKLPFPRHINIDVDNDEIGKSSLQTRLNKHEASLPNWGGRQVALYKAVDKPPFLAFARPAMKQACLL